MDQIRFLGTARSRASLAAIASDGKSSGRRPDPMLHPAFALQVQLRERNVVRVQCRHRIVTADHAAGHVLHEAHGLEPEVVVRRGEFCDHLPVADHGAERSWRIQHTIPRSEAPRGNGLRRLSLRPIFSHRAKRPPAHHMRRARVQMIVRGFAAAASHSRARVAAGYRRSSSHVAIQAPGKSASANSSFL